MTSKNHLAIIGAGNIGTSIAEGMVESGRLPAGSIALTRRKVGLLDDYKRRGFGVHSSNLEAVRKSDVILVSVEPQQIDGVLREIGAEIRPDTHVVVSVVSGVSIKQIKALLGAKVPVVRAMPNTAIAIRESMTCLAAESGDREAIGTAKSLFDAVGKSLVIDEEQMIAATALGACGIAFFPSCGAGGLARGDRDRPSHGPGAPHRRPDRPRRGVSAPTAFEAPRARNRPRHDAARLHDRGAQPNGARGIQLLHDTWDRNLGREGGGAV